MKLLRTIRFDNSDDNVYELAAGSDEWAVSGAFAFCEHDPGSLSGKTRQAFANGFLGLTSFGRSTFAVVGEADAQARKEAEDKLCTHFVTHFAAPDFEAARPAACEELNFIADLVSEAPINTVFTVRRYHDDEGQIREEFRTIKPPSGGPQHTRIWTVEDDNET